MRARLSPRHGRRTKKGPRLSAAAQVNVASSGYVVPRSPRSSQTDQTARRLAFFAACPARSEGPTRSCLAAKWRRTVPARDDPPVLADYQVASVFADGRRRALVFNPLAAATGGERVTLHATRTTLRSGVSGFVVTLRQACPRQKPRAQFAFKDSMIRGILQFTLRIAFRCVLHRCKSRDIHC